jgi:hypothetical protein
VMVLIFGIVNGMERMTQQVRRIFGEWINYETLRSKAANCVIWSSVNALRVVE